MPPAARFLIALIRLPRLCTHVFGVLRAIPLPLGAQSDTDRKATFATSSFSKVVQPLLSKLMQLDLKLTSTMSANVIDSRPVS